MEDWIGEDNPVRVIDVFVEELDLAELGFDGVAPEATGRPSYHPSVLLKLYICGYLNQVQSSRRLEQEAAHNVDGVMWLSGRCVPDHKTIADFRKDNGLPSAKCARALLSCAARWGLLTQASVAIDDGNKFKAVNNRDQELYAGEDGAADGADRGRHGALSAAARQRRPAGAVRGAQDQDERPEREDREAEAGGAAAQVLKVDMLATPDQQISLTDPDARSMATSGRGSGVVGYNVQDAVEAGHHLIVTHDVTNSSGSDRSRQLLGCWPR